MELCDRPIHALFAQRLAGETTAVEIVRSVLNRIGKMEPRLHAYITLTRDGMLENAEAADRRLADGVPLSPIDGMPLARKDIFCTQGIETT